MTYPGASLADHARAMGDNAVSRAVGFVVRIGVLLAAAVILVIVSLLAVIELLVWPLLPVAVLVTIVKGITG